MSVLVRLRAADVPERTFLTRDIGPGGMFLRSAQPLGIGSKVRLSFSLRRGEPLELDGEVAWNTLERPVAGKQGMGVRFLDVEGLSARRLEGFFGLSGASRRVVIVVDEPDLRAKLSERLRKEGLVVAAVGWGGAAAALESPHALGIVATETPAHVTETVRAAQTSRAPRIALIGPGLGDDDRLHRAAQFRFHRPVDLERVALIAVSLVGAKS